MSLTIRLNDASPEKLFARKAMNKVIEDNTNALPNWDQLKTVEEFRQMQRNGTHGFPKPVYNPAAKEIKISSTHGDHQIILRCIKPMVSPVKGVFLHFHPGGLVAGSADGADPYLTVLANDLSLSVVSVEYRLAPEHIFPAAGEDCLDAAIYALSSEGEVCLGGTMKVIGGESAGAYLSVWVALQLRDRGIDVREKIPALVLQYGFYDLTFLPSAVTHKRRVVMGFEDMKKFIQTSFPSEKYTREELKEGKWSPIYSELNDLPPAFFLVGTADPLMDDSVFMAAKWSLAGNRAKLKIIPEGGHAFTLLPIGEIAEEGHNEVFDFLRRYVGVGDMY